jgi:hypothetical protein
VHACFIKRKSSSTYKYTVDNKEELSPASDKQKALPKEQNPYYKNYSDPTEELT